MNPTTPNSMLPVVHPMKQLKSRSRDLRDLFENNITVRHIAEELEPSDINDDAAQVRAYMEDRDFDLMAIRERNVICAYVERSRLESGRCGDYRQPFQLSDVITDSTPLLDLFQILRARPSIFVLYRTAIRGIVTRGDLQKAPVRMLLFGLTSLLEMHLLQFIRMYHPQDSWKAILSQNAEGKGQLSSAESLYKKKQKRNEEIDLADCLYFYGKGLVVLHTPQLLERLKITDDWGRSFLEPANLLRNNLAHGSDVAQNLSWPKVMDLANDIEDLLARCEALNEV